MARKARISAAIADLMAHGSRHAWTLEQLREGLAGRRSKPVFSSMFRAVEKLVTVGALNKLLLEDGRARFELASPHHDHLHCSRCDELVAVPCVFNHSTLVDLERNTEIAITDHRVIFRGLCPRCRSAAAQKATASVQG